MESYRIEDMWIANGSVNNLISNSIPSDYKNTWIKQEPRDDYEINLPTNTDLNKNDNTLEVVEVGEVIRKIKKEVPVITLSDESNDFSQINVQSTNETSLTETTSDKSKTSKEITFGNRSVNLVPHVGPIFDEVFDEVTNGPVLPLEGLNELTSRTDRSSKRCFQVITRNFPDQSQTGLKKVVAQDKNNFFHTGPMTSRVLQNSSGNSVRRVENLNVSGFVSNAQFNEGREQLQTANSYHEGMYMDAFTEVANNATAQNRNSRRKVPNWKIKRVCVPQNCSENDSASETFHSAQQFCFPNGIADKNISRVSNGEKNLFDKILLKPKKRKSSLKITEQFSKYRNSTVDERQNKDCPRNQNKKKRNKFQKIKTFLEKNSVAKGLSGLWQNLEHVTEIPSISVPLASAGSSDSQIYHENDELRTNCNSANLICKKEDFRNKDIFHRSLPDEEPVFLDQRPSLKRYQLRTILEENCDSIYSEDLLKEFLPGKGNSPVKDKSPEKNVEGTLSANEIFFINSETHMQSVNTKLIKTPDEGEFFYSPDGRKYYSFNITLPFITPSETCFDDFNIASKHSLEGNSIPNHALHSNSHSTHKHTKAADSVSGNNTSEGTQQVHIGSNNQSQSDSELEPGSTCTVNDSYQSSQSEFNIFILEMRGNNSNGFKMQQSPDKTRIKCNNFGLFYERINRSSVQLLIKELSKEPKEFKQNALLHFWPAAVYKDESSVELNTHEERSSPFSLPSGNSNSVQNFKSHIFIGFSNLPMSSVINFIIKNSLKLYPSDKTVPTNSSDATELNVFSACPIQRDIESDSVIDSNLHDTTEIKKDVMNENVTSRSELSTFSTWVNGVNITSDENVTNQADNDEYLSDECIILEENASASNLNPDRITGSSLEDNGNSFYETGPNSNHTLSSETAESLLPVNLGNNGVPNLSHNRDISNYSTQQINFPVSRIKEEISKDVDSQCGEQIFPHTSFNCQTQHSSSQQVPVYSNNNVVYSENILHAVNNFIMLPPNQMDMNNSMIDTTSVTVPNVNFNPNQCNRIMSHNFSDSQLGIPHSLSNVTLHQPFGVPNQLQWHTSHRTHQVKQYSGNISNHQFEKHRYEQCMENQASGWTMDEVNNSVPNNLDRSYRSLMNERGVDRSFLQTSGGNIIKETMSNGLKCDDLQPCTNPRKESAVSNDTTVFPSHNVYTFPPPIGLSLAYQQNNSSQVSIRNQKGGQKEYSAINTSIPNGNAVASLELSAYPGRVPYLTNELLFSNGTGTISNACSSSVHFSPAVTSDEIFGDDYQRITNQSLTPNSYETIVQHQSYSKDHLFNPGNGGLFAHTNHVISELPVSSYQQIDCNFLNSSVRNVPPSSSSDVKNEDGSKMCDRIMQAIKQKDEKFLSFLYSEVERLRDNMQMMRIAIHLAFLRSQFEEVIQMIQYSRRFPPAFHKELQLIWIQAWECIENQQLHKESPGRIRDRHPFPDSIYVEATRVLNDAYNEDMYPKLDRRKRIADSIGFTEKQVNTWFKNRRQRTKREQEELAAGRTKDAAPGRPRRGRRRSANPF
ncbi:homeobox domain-containing protein [Trichonephila clavata]|uniref:Homeobox domain-containing protein n=1 Tax=Trichonephila clavata TaxID=2740835 RepID=A0A8X6HAU7_TRICU|nr:homeobox domain-containing protein [Trichonephila clavata]